MSKFTKPKLYTGKPLYGDWIVTYKIDGVRARITPSGVFSRNDKPLYNLDKYITNEWRDVEVFCGSWEETITKVRSQSPQNIEPHELYSLDPIDDRLIVKTISYPSVEDIDNLLNDALEKKYEGLVIRQGNNWLKVKPYETHDVVITGIIPGKGKYTGMLGAFETEKGNVGTGLTDQHRLEYNDASIIGNTIEVYCMELTKDGKFRHPRFIRMRYDK